MFIGLISRLAQQQPWYRQGHIADDLCNAATAADPRLQLGNLRQFAEVRMFAADHNNSNNCCRKFQIKVQNTAKILQICRIAAAGCWFCNMLLDICCSNILLCTCLFVVFWYNWNQKMLHLLGKRV